LPSTAQGDPAQPIPAGLPPRTDDRYGCGRRILATFPRLYRSRAGAGRSDKRARRVQGNQEHKGRKGRPCSAPRQGLLASTPHRPAPDGAAGACARVCHAAAGCCPRAAPPVFPLPP